MMSKEEMRDQFEARWGQTNDEQGLYFIPELNTYGCELAKNRSMADRKSSAWYYFQLGQESALVATPKADAQPVAGQSRFTSQKDWQPCSYEHHLMVIANPGEWPGYETRALFTRSDAGEVDRLNTVVEQQKNLIASLRAELRESHSITTIPDGYCVMPRRLTAENGAKALLLGEFNVRVTNDCPECVDLDEPDEYCEICDGEGEYEQKHMIPWDLIKFIYSKAVEGLAAKADPEDLWSRPEERGCPELEPCSGCGTPGWTAACEKCIPY
jgi:hypothetical protein